LAHGTALPSRRLAQRIVTCAGRFLVLLDVTVVDVALLGIARDLASSIGRLQCPVDASTIVLVSTMLACGSAGDRLPAAPGRPGTSPDGGGGATPPCPGGNGRRIAGGYGRARGPRRWRPSRVPVCPPRQRDRLPPHRATRAMSAEGVAEHASDRNLCPTRAEALAAARTQVRPSLRPLGWPTPPAGWRPAPPGPKPDGSKRGRRVRPASGWAQLLADGEAVAGWRRLLISSAEARRNAAPPATAPIMKGRRSRRRDLNLTIIEATSWSRPASGRGAWTHPLSTG